jgi:hypothetical protein
LKKTIIFGLLMAPTAAFADRYDCKLTVRPWGESPRVVSGIFDFGVTRAPLSIPPFRFHLQKYNTTDDGGPVRTVLDASIFYNALQFSTVLVPVSTEWIKLEPYHAASETWVTARCQRQAGLTNASPVDYEF